MKSSDPPAAAPTLRERPESVLMEVGWMRAQHSHLFDQWGIRIAHCPNPEPHGYHGWTHYEDLRCPGVPDRSAA